MESNSSQHAGDVDNHSPPRSYQQGRHAQGHHYHTNKVHFVDIHKGLNLLPLTVANCGKVPALWTRPQCPKTIKVGAGVDLQRTMTECLA